MGLDNALDDSEADACAGFVFVGLVEGTEDLLLVFFRNAGTVIADSDGPRRIVGLYTTYQSDIVLCVFERIAQQIADELGDGFAVETGRKVVVG